MGSESYRLLDMIKLSIDSSCQVLSLPYQSDNQEMILANNASARQTLELSLRKLRNLIEEEANGTEN